MNFRFGSNSDVGSMQRELTPHIAMHLSINSRLSLPGGRRH